MTTAYGNSVYLYGEPAEAMKLLIDAHAYIERGWTGHTVAVDTYAVPAPPQMKPDGKGDEGVPVAWDCLGAILASVEDYWPTSEDETSRSDDPRKLLRSQMEEDCTELLLGALKSEGIEDGLCYWNDAPNRSQGNILWLFNTAVGLVKMGRTRVKVVAKKKEYGDQDDT